MEGEVVHTDKPAVDPQDFAQWEFYAVPTRALNERERSQHSITLPGLKSLAQPVGFGGLLAAIQHAASA